MEKDGSRESKLILGKIYREVKVDKVYTEVINSELKYSIQLNYKLLPWVVNTSNNTRLT